MIRATSEPHQRHVLMQRELPAAVDAPSSPAAAWLASGIGFAFWKNGLLLAFSSANGFGLPDVDGGLDAPSPEPASLHAHFSLE